MRTRVVLVLGALLPLPIASLAAAPLDPKTSSVPIERTSPLLKRKPGVTTRPGAETRPGTVTTSPDGRWELAGDGLTVRDTTTGRTWERAPSATRYDWSTAKAHCDNKTFAGQSDWRLPRVDELHAIFVHGGDDLGLPAGHFFTPGATEYWTSSDGEVNASYILVGNGNLFGAQKTTPIGAWCVRGGGNTSYPNTNPRFKVVGDTVEDVQTGRVWKRGTTVMDDWYASRIACRAHGYEWRLATRDELVGLLDLSVPESPKLPLGHPFANAWGYSATLPLWTLDSASVTDATTVRFSDGAVASTAKTTTTTFGRCIKIDPAATWPAGAAGRFVVQGDAVLDQETRLWWERAPADTLSKWGPANTACQAKSIGGQTGWRLPTVDEITSLIDYKATTAPKLPAGHPFTGVQLGTYWTSTNIQYLDMRTFNFATTSIGAMSQPGASLLGWCVRPG